MRIGVVTTSYPRFPGDPAGNFVGAHVEAMRTLGHEVDVVAAGDSVDGLRTSDFGLRTSETRVPSSLFYRGGAPDEIERSWRALPAAAVFAARLAFEVRRHFGSGNPRLDLLISHWLAPSALAALPVRVPLLAIAHGGDVHLLRRLRLLGPVLHALRLRDARLAFVSAELLELARAAAPSLARWLEHAAIVQPMGIDVAHFARIPRAPASPPEILVASRLVPIKGIDVALDALAHLRTPARLVIAGDGPERAVLEARATARAQFVGSVPTDERDRLLATASVVVIPSRVLPGGRSEGVPLVALEALAARVPVVASEVGGLRELRALAPDLALVPPGDPPALASAIDRILAAPPPPADLTALDWPRVASRLLCHAPRNADSSRRCRA